MNFKMSDLAQLILNSKNIILTTHKNCDGDGLGSLLAIHHALSELGKNSTPISIDKISERYSFLNTQKIQNFEKDPFLPQNTDLILIFDTNDERLVAPLIKKAQKMKLTTVYIDHHPILTKGPQPTATSIIDTRAASTAELAYQLIEILDVKINPKIAEALYTSIIFDTQVFRFIKSNPEPFLISAKLLNFIDDPSLIHKKLFAHQSPNKIRYLGKALKKLKLFFDEKVAYLFLDHSTRFSFGISEEETLDIIDFLSEIKDLKFVTVTRENSDGSHKISFRSLSNFCTLKIAEEFGGGGHVRASGAYINDVKSQNIETMVIQMIEKQMKQQDKDKAVA